MVNAADVVGFDVYPIFGYGTPGWLNHPASGVKQLIQIAESRPVFIWIESGKAANGCHMRNSRMYCSSHPLSGMERLDKWSYAIGYFTVCGAVFRYQKYIAKNAKLNKKQI